MEKELEVVFKLHRLRSTVPRHAIFAALHQAGEPLSIGKLGKLCPDVDRVSIYRTIQLFTKLHIVETVTIGWKQRYELASPFAAHHHHLHCTQCGALIEVHSGSLEMLINHIAKQYDFMPQEHRFEVSGLCKQCLRANAR